MPLLFLVKHISRKVNSTKLVTIFDPNAISKNLDFQFKEKIVLTKMLSGRSIFVNVNDHIGFRIYMYGEYDNTILWVAKALKFNSNDLLLDIGSHIGAVSLPVAIAFDTPVIAIEGNSRNASLCLLNYSINQKRILMHNCFVLSKDLALKTPWISYYRPNGNSGGSSIFETFARNKIKHLEYSYAHELDFLLDNVQVRSLSLIKMDVEGSESEVFDGFKKIRHVDCPIIFEYRIDLIPENKLKDYQKFLELLRKKFSIFVIYANDSKVELDVFDEKKSYNNLIAIPSIKIDEYMNKFHSATPKK